MERAVVLVLLCGSTLADVIATTKNGAVRGIYEGDVKVFRGIPFAAPPVRWKPPQPPTNWSGIRDTTQYAPDCIVDGAHAIPGSSEDCLYLNVHVHTTPPPPQGAAVLVWVHGGGYEGGTGAQNGTAMTELLNGDLIVVSLNYRLNIFGFLGGEALRSRDPKGSSGNYGIQDQRMAFMWVRDNIAQVDIPHPPCTQSTP